MTRPDAGAAGSHRNGSGHRIGHRGRGLRHPDVPRGHCCTKMLTLSSRHGRTPSPGRRRAPDALVRDATLRTSKYLRRAIWQRWSGYHCHCRSRVESQMNCLKRLGQSLMVRDVNRQVAKRQVLNRDAAPGKPVTEPAGQVRPRKGEAQPSDDLGKKGRPASKAQVFNTISTNWRQRRLSQACPKRCAFHLSLSMHQHDHRSARLPDQKHWPIVRSKCQQSAPVCCAASQFRYTSPHAQLPA